MLRKDRDFYRKKVWALQKSRASWKVKRKPSIRVQRAGRKRETVLNAFQDVEFMVEFNVTGRARRRMKSFFRKHKVDFFSRTKEWRDLMNNLAPNSDWTYSKVNFPVFSELRAFLENRVT